MGIRLIVEVLDHAPADLTPTERLVLVIIAEKANDETRRGWPGMDVLCHRSGLKPASMQKLFRRLADRGLEVRVPLGSDSKGRPVFAYTGKRTVYELPRLAPIHSTVHRADHRPPITEEKGGPPSAQRPDHRPQKGGPPSAPFPQGTLKDPSAAARAAIPEATDEEITAVTAQVRRDKPNASEALIRHILKDDGPQLVEDLRATRQRAIVTAAMEAAKTQPQCVHGQHGGAVLHPISQQPWCASCRHTAKESA